MSRTVQLNASSIGGTIQTSFSGGILVPANGLITVDVRDAPQLLAAGASYVNQYSRRQVFSTAPIAATAGRIVASTTLSNGTLSIANQPDVPRVCGIRVDPGTSAITAGTLTAIYVANDGTTTTDAISLVTAASTVFTTNTSKGVVLASSFVVTGLTGGASPLVQVNNTQIPSVQVDPGFVNFSVVRADVDNASETIGTVTSSAASILPNTAPNGTHTYGFYYNYVGPNT